MHFAYSNHSFLPVSKTPVAPDTIWATLSKDPAIKSHLKQTAMKDLDLLLTLRHRELVKGGVFMFDLLATHEIPDKSCWVLLNTVLQQYIDAGKITQEERDHIGMRNCQRDDEVIYTVLDKHKDNFKVIYNEKTVSRFVAWGKYLEHKDAKRLAEEYIAWLKEWTPGAILLGLSQERSPAEKAELISGIYEEVCRVVADNPMPLDIEIYNFIVEKTN